VHKGAIKVLYIAGFWRSGSTLLDRLLGHADGLVSVGELARLWELGMRDNAPCSCGAVFADCEFWGNVLRRAGGGVDQFAFYDHLSADLLSIHAGLKDRLRLWRQSEHRQPSRASVDGLAGLYRAIAATGDSEVVVDSSKMISYALLVHSIADIDLQIVHLVRDSRAVAYSWEKNKIMFRVNDLVKYMGTISAYHSAVDWIRRNAAIEYSKSMGVRYLRVRYEDLATRPERTVDQIGEFIGKKLVGIPFTNSNGVDLSPGHLVYGNPMRFQQGGVAIRLDDAWRRKMRLAHRLVVTAITWPMLLRYGYFQGAPGGLPAGRWQEESYSSCRG
jgi:hypothetical protein